MCVPRTDQYWKSLDTLSQDIAKYEARGSAGAEVLRKLQQVQVCCWFVLVGGPLGCCVFVLGVVCLCWVGLDVVEVYISCIYPSLHCYRFFVGEDNIGDEVAMRQLRRYPRGGQS